ncbi:hypothetical protein L1987_72898 [Smallanthus sonchifolius]|uniref:Uncharacterized protein n=1 Tax=Smallanthus sonchifolius TaxID=185202 RepID=A0ACB9AX58_9ASTR|nr:hypothetical protein L1987_72898 [Smallanthus sonchifolius]
MRNANEDSNSSSWHLLNTLTSGHYYDSFTPRTVTDAYIGQDKDELKQKMLQHEATFKNQVYELHRLYRRQRDIMEEVKRKESHKHHISIDTASSSSLMPCQKPYEDANRWQNPSFPLANSTSIPSIFGAEISNSPLSCSKGNDSKDCEIVECRPSKVRKKLFDLQLPAHENIVPEEGEHVVDNQISEISSYPAKQNGSVTKNGVKTFLDDGGKKDGYKNTASDKDFIRSNGLVDLNEPVYGQDVDFLGPAAKLAGFSNLSFEGKNNRRDGISSCPRETGNGRSNMNQTSQCFETIKLLTPDTMQHLHGKEVQHRGTYSEISSKFQDHSHFSQIPLLFSPPSAYPFTGTSGMGNSWGPPWGKSNDSLTHKLTFFQTHPSFLSSHKTHEVFRDRWHRNGNGFHNGSSSGSKEFFARVHSVGFDYRNSNKLDGESQKTFKGSSFVDLTGTTKDMDLNSVQNLSKEDNNSRNCDQTVLPWLKAKPIICKNGDYSGDMAKKKDDSLGANKKLLASIEHREIDINVAWDDDEDTDKQIDVKKDEEIKNHFDLNSCVTEDDDLLVTESFKSSKKKTMEIDLEAPAVSEIEEEDEHKETELKPDHLESKELEKIAAEAIVAISSQQDHAGPVSKAANENEHDYIDDPLLWFVDVIDSCEKNIASATREIDEYETLTLQLEETKEEDYMPTPLVPDFQESDEVGPDLTSSRPRRGQARRGRPRRDFQRDILPGMTSLSRNEITEDLQIFGGLMRATGHSWNLGSARRNGKQHGARGRRKVKEVETTPSTTISPPPPLKLSPPSKQVNSVEVLRLKERGLTGWGKTTRRPRRQRCAAGITVAVQLR